MFTQEELTVVQAVTYCLLLSAERTERAIFYILITITLEENMIFTNY